MKVRWTAPLAVVLILALVPIQFAHSSGDTVRMNTVGNPPVAVATATPSIIEVGGAVYLSAGGSLVENWVRSCVWNYTIGERQVALLGYDRIEWFNTTGDYTIWLTIFDQAGLSNSTSVDISVFPKSGTDQPPVAEAGPDIWAAVNSQVEFFEGGSTDDTFIVVYYWTVDSGWGPQILFGMRTGTQFIKVGNFTLSLSVIDSAGLWSTDTATVHIVHVAEAGPDQTVSVGQEVKLDGSGSNLTGGLTCSWSFVDGAPITIDSVIAYHTFDNAGDYMATFRVFDSFGNVLESDVMMVYVLAPSSIPKAEAGPNATIDSGTTFTFNGSRSTGDIPDVGYVWTFHYNRTWAVLYGKIQAFKFDIPGVYIVKLTITDSSGLSSNDSMVLTIKKPQTHSPMTDLGIWLVIIGSEAGLVVLSAFVYARHVRGRRK